ncbi:hypothetical protein QBC42DRAFT_282739 [Cladorrhinum samala]|uniref:t-SNARE coiled-coil homology domain-containing protein n=1 Tax=Cladorrhinum samala TaxID=585594 RepID=A0AAV9I351_9PEZI|nr:hypothetical protein QBC42DRAFT_282739 [Cladorrhinum samala]
MGGLFRTSETPPALPSYITANPRIRRGYGASSAQQANNWNDFPGYAAYNRQYFTSDDDSEKADGGTEYHGNDVSSFIFPSSDDTDTQLQDELPAMSASQEDSLGTVVHHSGVSVATPVMAMAHLDQETFALDFKALTLRLDQVENSYRDIKRHISDDNMEHNHQQIMSNLGRQWGVLNDVRARLNNLERIILQRGEVTANDTCWSVQLSVFLVVVVIALGVYLGLRC